MIEVTLDIDKISKRDEYIGQSTVFSDYSDTNGNGEWTYQGSTSNLEYTIQPAAIFGAHLKFHADKFNIGMLGFLNESGS